MSHAIASSKAMPAFLAHLSTRQCQRCYSSSAMQSTKQLRPTVPRAPMQSRQPIVQRRTKYKTIEQAKSRYSTGVCDRPYEIVDLW
jgi:protein SCO1/2